MSYIKNRQLYVNDAPFLIRGGELQNSSMSSAEYMRTRWEKLKSFNLNTVLGPVTWDQVEPEEGHFDFSELTQCIYDARSHGLKLVLLWFGAFKNGMSSYAPGWIKKDTKRFPRMKIRDGTTKKSVEVLSIFDERIKEADAKAFAELMKHIRKVDEDYLTVIMVQCENEAGLLGDSRDFSDLSNEAFNSSVPEDLLEFFKSDWHNMHYTLKNNIESFTYKLKGTWEEVFGLGERVDEIFMAYYYARYVDYVAYAGKQQYNIPIFTNVWQNEAASADAAGGGKPGKYPSGGAVGNVLDIWIKFAPTLSFISPDIYLNDYDERSQWYSHRNQPYFVPEHRRDAFGARRVLLMLGKYCAFGACPFGIDTLEEGNEYQDLLKLIQEVEFFILKAQQTPEKITGFYFDEYVEGETTTKEFITTKYKATIERSRVFGKPDTGYGMIIELSDDEFLLIGAGFQVRFSSLEEGRKVGFLRVAENVALPDGSLTTRRWFNGDETQSGNCVMMPNKNPDYAGYPVAITIGAETRIATASLYNYEI
ncbi:beta-galactosidase [Dipodascopsis uninucleata]